jgi:hypothetical protein
LELKRLGGEEGSEEPVECGERREEEDALVEVEWMRGAEGLKSAWKANAGAGGARSMRDSGKLGSWGCVREG